MTKDLIIGKFKVLFSKLQTQGHKFVNGQIASNGSIMGEKHPQEYI